MPTDQERIAYLLRRYSASQASPEEARELFAWLEQADNDAPLKAHMQDLWQQLKQEAPLEEVRWDDMFARILHPPARHDQQGPAADLQHQLPPALNTEGQFRSASQPGAEGRILLTDAPPRPHKSRWPAIAATITILLAISAAAWFYFDGKPAGPAPLAQATGRHIRLQATDTRRVSLPDGSWALLRPGSTLEYTDSLPGNPSREVSLSGEAWFDVAHRPDQPFVIHSGRLTTTVLGTAFNIKAWPGEKDITVTVAEGRVRVEDGKQVLGVLERDKQIVYNTATQLARQEQVTAITATGWVKQDMTFDNTPFSAIAAQLGRRYQVNIRFSDPGLGNCPVTASFNGTEPLEEVLTVVCVARNATYTIHDGQVLINGAGCREE